MAWLGRICADLGHKAWWKLWNIVMARLDVQLGDVVDTSVRCQVNFTDPMRAVRGAPDFQGKILFGN
jgi:hypothetical protein